MTGALLSGDKKNMVQVFSKTMLFHARKKCCSEAFFQNKPKLLGSQLQVSDEPRKRGTKLRRKNTEA